MHYHILTLAYKICAVSLFSSSLVVGDGVVECVCVWWSGAKMRNSHIFLLVFCRSWNWS